MFLYLKTDAKAPSAIEQPPIVGRLVSLTGGHGLSPVLYGAQAFWFLLALVIIVVDIALTRFRWK